MEDLNASQFNKTKTHDIRILQPNGKFQIERFKFVPHKPLAMPQDKALTFLERDPSFRVRNSRNQIIRPKSGPQAGERMVNVKQNEIVVPLTYVLARHLYEMARELPGGREKFPQPPTNRQDLEEFIIAGGTQPDDEMSDIDTVAVSSAA